MKNYYVLLFCFLVLSYWTKKSEIKMTIESEEIAENNGFALRNLEEEEDEPSPTPDPTPVEPPRNYHKSSGGLSKGGVAGIAVAGAVVAVGALALAFLAKGATAVVTTGAAGASTGANLATSGLQGGVPEFSIQSPHVNADTLGAVEVVKV